MSRPPFPEVIDSSLMAAFKSCGQKANLEFIQHWKLQNQSVHLHAGAAYATGQEVTRHAYYIDGKQPDDALAEGLHALLTAYGDFECPPDSAKSAQRMAGALEFYYSHYRLGVDKAIPLTLLLPARPAKPTATSRCLHEQRSPHPPSYHRATPHSRREWYAYSTGLSADQLDSHRSHITAAGDQGRANCQ